MGIFKKGVNVLKKGVNLWVKGQGFYYTKLAPILLDTVTGGQGGSIYNDLLNINQDGTAIQAFQEPVDSPPPNSDNTMMYILAGGAILILILTILLLRKK